MQDENMPRQGEPAGSASEILSKPGTDSSKADHSLTERIKSKLQDALVLLKRRPYIAIAIVGLLIGASIASYFMFFKAKPAPPAPAIVKQEEPPPEPPKPTTEASRLTGIQVKPELNALPVTGVMIENSPDARPQSGLSTAGIVFEAIAEGGITRFLALYLEDQPDYIGPVRSVRPYFLDFLVPFDAALAHAGGSAEALAQVRNEGIKDIDHGVNGGTYQRVTNRFAPHNLYTSRAKLLEAHNRRGYTTSNFTSWPRKEQETPLETPTAKTIDFALSGQLYNTHYDYDKATNSYKRVMAGRPHIDERSGEQISPKVVIAIVTSRSQNGIYSVYQVTGSGTVIIFQDGGVIEGTWEKADRKSPYVFKTPDGQPLKLNPGRTWVTLATPGSVRHAP